ncbi:hypothetical protein OS493_030083 [Desmophyllum pertusum]|uniref:VWFA domain-containing protein n=1 Tax=Desmophyllum pertusum TaxID=174260 RepID=A0A9W9Z921_9CNID|nr:hypothetical protein OS493_030083 [Desmophyllum pertusum]
MGGYTSERQLQALNIHSIAGFFVYAIYFRPKESLKTFKLVSKRFKDSSLYKSLGLTEFHAIKDKFATVEEVSFAIKSAGLESSNLIIGVDFTASNEWQGRKSFGGRSLHHIYNHMRRLNPYQRVVQIISKTLEPFDEDNLIPAFGFGDSSTKDHSVLSFNKDGSPCKGLNDVLKQYSEVVRRVTLSGPTTFAPLINKAIEIVKQEKSYNILVIIADGQVVDEHDRSTREAIVEASNFPLSIIVVGVGDGPWDRMHEYDELLPQRRFDNFQFVEYEDVIHNAKYPDTSFALHALMEVPDQYKAIKEMGLIELKSKDD